MTQLGNGKGISPAWANLGRRYCDDCGKRYKLKRPLLEGQRGFCSNSCRYAYHHHGGSYRKLKVEVQKMVTKEILQFHRDQEKIMKQVILSMVNQTAGGYPEFLQVLRREAADERTEE